MLLALTLVLAYLPVQPIHAETVASGTCGSNMTWKLDLEGILTISGEGSMYDYFYSPYGGTVPPWNSYAGEITAVVMTEGITYIGDYAFDDCTAITEITIPASVTEMGTGVFHFCGSLARIRVASGSTAFASVDGVLFSADKTTLVAFPAAKNASSYTIPDTVTTVADYAFYRCKNLTEIQFGKNVTSTGIYAFANTALTAVTVPSSVTDFGYGAFSGCSNLGSATIPGSVGVIGGYTFSDCYNLKSVTLGIGITEIENRAFDECSSLQSIVIPAGTEEIGTYAFYCCPLKLVVIPGSVRIIDNNAFNIIGELDHVLYTGSIPSYIGDNNTSLNKATQHTGAAGTEAVLNSDGTVTCSLCTVDVGGTCGDNLTWTLDAEGTLTISGTGYMDDYDEDPAPWKNHQTEIKKIILEDGVKDIGDDAFYGCSALTTVEMADSVIGIGGYAFAECSSLQRVSIGSGVTSIRSFAFNGCDSLVAFSVDEQNTVFSNDAYGVLFNKDKTALITAPATLSGAYTVPEGVISIGGHAFNGCSGMTAVTLPDSLTTIGDYAFLDCAGLKTIEIPGKVTYIGSCAFYYCYGLDELRFCGNIPSIADFAFSTVTAKAYYPGNNATWTSDRLKGYQGSITWIPYGPATVAEGTCGDNLTWTLDAEGTLTVSGEGAMANYASATEVPWYDHREKIETVAVQTGVTTLGDHAFFDCTNLKTALLPAGITAIGSNAFRQCADLSSITLPNSVTSIGSNAFCGCYALTEITIPADVTEIAYSTFYACTGLTKVTIPEGVTTIGAEAFNNCSSLTEITLPAGVTSVGDYAFNKCSKLADVYYSGNRGQWNAITIGESNDPLLSATLHADPTLASGTCGDNLTWELTEDGTLTISGTGAMTDYDYDNLSPWHGYWRDITVVIIKNGVSSIGNSAFESCSSLTTVCIGASVTSIGEMAFYNCTRLTEMAIATGIVNLSDVSSYLFIRSTPDATNSSNLIDKVLRHGDIVVIYDIALVDGVSWGRIADGWIPLQHVKDLKGVAEVSNIGGANLERNPGAAGVVISDSVTHIGNGAFLNCVSLTDVVIGKGVTSIGSNVFDRCRSLRGIWVNEENPNYSCDNCGVLFNKDKTILITAPAAMIGSYTVPQSTTIIRNGAFAFCEDLTNINIPASVTSIEYDATRFGGCNLTGIWVDENNPRYSSDSYGVLFDKDKTTLIVCPGGKTGAYVVPSTVTTIGASAFHGCINLNEVTISDGVTSIGDCAFVLCQNLSRLSIPDSITYVGWDAFGSAGGLPENLKCNTYDNARYLGNDANPFVILISGTDWNIASCDIHPDTKVIYTSAFRFYGNLTSITIPDGVVFIDDCAFCGCNNLTNVEIPDSVTFIDGAAFNGSANIQTIKLPNNITSIEGEMFGYCTGLTSIYIPEKVNKIGDGAFWYCTNLNEITFGGDAPSFGEDIFVDVTATAYYPADNETWTEEVRQNYGGNITWQAYSTGPAVVARGTCGENLTWVLTEDGTLTISGTGAIDHYSALEQAPWYDYRESVKAVVMEAGVTGIGRRAFLDCSSLERVTIPEGVTTIDMYSFQNCTSLTSVVIPEGVARIANSTFSGCKSLASVTIPGSVTYIEDSAFYDCSSLKSITIPDRVIGMGNGVFGNCSSLTSVTIPYGVTAIGESVFSYCENLTSVTIPDSVTTIDKYAFCNCSSLESITIPDSVTTIDDYVFQNCSALGEIFIPDSILTIGNYAFEGCTGLTGIWVDADNACYCSDESGVLINKEKTTLLWVPRTMTGSYTVPDGIKVISFSAFQDCVGLTHVSLPDSLIYIGFAAFKGCSGLTDIVIPQRVTDLGNSAFADCTGLTQIDIHEKLTCIANGAFSGCTGLTDVYYSGTQAQWDAIFVDENNDALLSAKLNTNILDRDTCGENLTWVLTEDGTLTISGTGAMDHFTYQNAPWEEYRDQIRAVVIEDGVTSVGRYAFYGYRSITAVTLGNTVADIANSTFSYCANLTEIRFPESVTNIGYWAFQGCEGLTQVHIPASVTAIGLYAFNDCDNLEKIQVAAENPNYCSDAFGVLFNKAKTVLLQYPQARIGDYQIPETVTTIEYSAFSGCSGLTGVTIPDSVTTIGDNAFRYCSSLETITLPGNLATLGDWVFAGCSSLKEITFQGNVPVFEGDSIFADVTATVSYPADRDGWTEEVRQNYGGNLTWKPYCIETHTEVTDEAVPVTCTTDGKTEGKHCSVCGEILIPQEVIRSQGHKYTAQVTAPTCTEDGYTTYTCSCADSYTAEPVTQLGHEWGSWRQEIAATPYGEGMERRDCGRCDAYETRSLAYHGTGMKLPAEQFAGHSTVWVDGLPYAIQGSGEERYVEIPEGNHSLVTYTYHEGDGQDVHTQYPTGMKVYLVQDGKLTYIPELDDLLQYSGSSIRIVGKKGIRMITSLTKDNKKALTGKGLAGFKLLEYGTALCFANEIPAGDGLVLGRSYTRSNFAYKKGEADPVFASPGNLIQYTNVLVGFSLDQCKEDIAMRPYIILEDAEGNQITIYGGTIYRSIGYIAYQNRSVFKPNTAAYDYVWELIHHVYGDKYDADYKG